MKNSIVYVCFVQNDLGVLSGEEPISCLTVTQDQGTIDMWLDEQVAEAAENGYLPDKDANTYKGTVDFMLPVSKGNDKEGYETYCLVCMTTVVE